MNTLIALKIQGFILGFIFLLQAPVRCNNTQGGSCMPGWVQSGQSCFQFNDIHMLNWAEASAECHYQAATLLRFETGDDMKAFAQLSKQYPVEGWWTDLNQQGHPGIWIWGDNEEAFNDALIWNQEPDDIKHVENCVAINSVGNVSDEMCSSHHGFICEYPNPPGTPGCADGWLGSSTSCYFLSDTTDYTEVVDWHTALNVCSKKVPGQTVSLVSFDNAAEYKYVVGLLGVDLTLNHRWWTGMNDQQQEGKWVWANNQPAQTSFLNWESAPSFFSKTRLCGLTHSNGHISDADCQQDNYFVCKLDMTAGKTQVIQQLGCPGLWSRAGQKCYYFSTRRALTHAEARTYCQQYGADLIKVESLDEMWWISMKTTQIRTNTFWTGLQRISHGSTTWQWCDGTPLNSRYIKWTSEPNNYNGQEDCAFINQDMTYVDASCFSKAGYICQMQSQNTPCPTGWLSHSDEGTSTCFYISNTTYYDQVTWWEAREQCNRLAGGSGNVYLLAMTTDGQAEFMMDQIMSLKATSAGWWTDLTDAASEGLWLYADSFLGQPGPNSISWAKEPNNMDEHEDCATIYFEGQYNDLDCNAKANVACEKKVSTTPSTSTLSSQRTTPSKSTLSSQRGSGTHTEPILGVLAAMVIVQRVY